MFLYSGEREAFANERSERGIFSELKNATSRIASATS
jgi:hypothetical protein